MTHKIIHLSDLHFGTEKSMQTEELINDCLRLNPDMILISGDLTQRARNSQFRAVKHFLSRLSPIKILCVPGNHDISLYNLVERFIYPFAKYKKWISSELCCSYSYKNIVVLGINSVTPFKSMSGFVTNKQLQMVTEFFISQPAKATRIVVMHHNLIRSERHRIINDADKILQTLAEAGVNLILSGHIHYPCVEVIKKGFISKNLYVVTAGTPISTRTSAPNSYNVIELNDNDFILSVRAWHENHFTEQSVNTFPL